MPQPFPRKPKTYRVGVQFHHTSREGPTLSGTLETEQHVVHDPAGYYYRSAPVYQISANSLRREFKKVRSETVTIGVVGELEETPENYEQSEYPPFQRTFLARVKDTRSAWTLLRSLPDDWYQIRKALSELTGFQWSTVETVYFTERQHVYTKPVVS